MTAAPKCLRCFRERTHAMAVDAGTLVLCRRQAEQLATALAADPVVKVGRRWVRLEVPRLEAVRR